MDYGESRIGHKTVMKYCHKNANTSFGCFNESIAMKDVEGDNPILLRAV